MHKIGLITWARFFLLARLACLLACSLVTWLQSWFAWLVRGTFHTWCSLERDIYEMKKKVNMKKKHHSASSRMMMLF